MSEESGSMEIVGPPAKSQRNPMFHQRVYKLTNSAGNNMSKPKSGKLFGNNSQPNFSKTSSKLSKYNYGKSTNVIYPVQNSYSGSRVQRSGLPFNNSSTVIHSNLKRRNEEINIPSSFVHPKSIVYKCKKPVNRISTLIDLDSSPGKIKRTLQKYKEIKLVAKNLRTVSEDPKFDQSLVYQYKSK